MGYCADLVDKNFFVPAEYAGKVMKKMNDYGYSVELDDDGNIIDADFPGDKLVYGEKEMFQAIAPYVKDGSFLEMFGEDGSRWRQVFKNGTCKEIVAKTVWPDEK
jgi:hypothetical protein